MRGRIWASCTHNDKFYRELQCVPDDVLFLLRQLLLNITLQAPQQKRPQDAMQPLHDALEASNGALCFGVMSCCWIACTGLTTSLLATFQYSVDLKRCRMLFDGNVHKVDTFERPFHSLQQSCGQPSIAAAAGTVAAKRVATALSHMRP